MHYLIKACDVNIGLYDNDRCIPFANEIRHIRNLPVSVEPLSAKVNFRDLVIVRRGNHFSCRFQGSSHCKLDLVVPSQTRVSKESLCDLLYQFVSFISIRDDVLILHSGSVSHNGNTFLIIGDSGAGKSDVILQLTTRFGYQLITDDRVCLRKIGSTFQILNKDEILMIRGLDSIGNKKHYVPIIRDNAELSDSQTVAFLFFPHFSLREGYMKRLERSHVTETLARQILSTMRGTDFCIIDDSGQFVSYAPILPEVATEHLRAVLNPLCQNTPAYSIFGNLDFICDQINQTLDTK